MYMSREVCHQRTPGGGSRSAHDGRDDKRRSRREVLRLVTPEPWRMLLDQEEDPGVIRTREEAAREGLGGTDRGY